MCIRDRNGTSKTPANTLLHFGNAAAMPWSLINRHNYSDLNKLTPPDYTIYTVFQLKQVFVMFLAGISLQVLFIWLAKLWNSQKFRKWNIFDQFLHAVTNIHIPYPVQDWCDGKGNPEKHYERMLVVQWEIISCMIINFIFNCIAMVPLLILGKL